MNNITEVKLFICNDSEQEEIIWPGWSQVWGKRKSLTAWMFGVIMQRNEIKPNIILRVIPPAWNSLSRKLGILQHNNCGLPLFIRVVLKVSRLFCEKTICAKIRQVCFSFFFFFLKWTTARPESLNRSHMDVWEHCSSLLNHFFPLPQLSILSNPQTLNCTDSSAWCSALIILVKSIVLNYVRTFKKKGVSLISGLMVLRLWGDYKKL